MRVYRWERWGVHTPVTIERVRKQLKREGLASRRRAQHEEKHRGKEKRQQGCRVPNAGLPIYYNNREGRTSQGKVGGNPVCLRRRRKRQAEMQKGPPIRIGGPLRLRDCAAARR